MGIPNPTTNKLEPHNCWLVSVDNLKTKACANKYKADIVKDYIEWAVQRNYAVIDVNIPKYVTADGVSCHFTPCPVFAANCFKVSRKIRRRR